jgi:polyisoprenoid-binding protein YceI
LIYESTSITRTGPTTADILGNLTLKGVTKPVTLQATFNGGYEGHPMDPAARIGFSARGVLKRSDFGIDIGIPAPGSTMGVFDEVTISIETEFTGPPLAALPPSQP